MFLNCIYVLGAPRKKGHMPYKGKNMLSTYFITATLKLITHVNGIHTNTNQMEHVADYLSAKIL